MTAREPWVMLRGEICCTGLWSMEGYVVDPDDLPISMALKARLARWADWYDDEDTDYEGTPWEMLPGKPVAAYNAEGRALAVLLKAELPPTWTVVAKDVDTWCRKDRAPDLSDCLFALTGDHGAPDSTASPDRRGDAASSGSPLHAG